MKDKNAIDKIFKDNLDNKGMPYSQANWDRMEVLLAKNNPISASWYKWGALALLILGTSALVYYSPWNKHVDYETTKTRAITNAETSVNSIETPPKVEGQIENQIAAEKTKEYNYSTTAVEAIESDKKEQRTPLSTENFSNEIPESGNSNQRGEGLQFEDHQYLLLTMNSIDHIQFPVPNQPKAGTDKNVISSKQNPFSLYVSPYLGLFNYSKSHNISSSLKDNESPNSGGDFGIQLRLARNNWGLITGLASTQLSENTNYVEKVRTYNFDTSFVLAQRKFIQLPNGSYIARVEERIDTNVVESDTIICSNCEARFSYISIPFNAYYEMRRNRIGLFTQAGLTFNFLRSSSGPYTNNENSESIDPLVNPAASKQTISMNALVGVKYHLSSKLNVQMSYGQNWNMNSMMLNYNQKAQLQQLRIGVEWKMF